MKTSNKFLVSQDTLLCACTKQLCMSPAALPTNVSECRLFYCTHVFSIGEEVNRAVAPQHTLAIFSIRAVTILPSVVSQK